MDWWRPWCACWPLAGCGGQSGGEAGYTKEQVQELLDSGAFTDVLDELDCDTAWALYGLEEAGLSREDLTDGVIYRSAGATCEELSLLIFADSGAAKTAQGALESYLQSQIENNRDYRPGEIPKLEDAVLRQEGSTVLRQFPPIPRRWRRCWDKKIWARGRISARGPFCCPFAGREDAPALPVSVPAGAGRRFLFCAFEQKKVGRLVKMTGTTGIGHFTRK